jgi:hypothetical protein
VRVHSRSIRRPDKNAFGRRQLEQPPPTQPPFTDVVSPPPRVCRRGQRGVLTTRQFNQSYQPDPTTHRGTPTTKHTLPSCGAHTHLMILSKHRRCTLLSKKKLIGVYVAWV